MSFLFTKEKIDKYYKDSFLTDLFNYFDIANCGCNLVGDRLFVTESTYFASLFPKDSNILDEDSVTPICYRWLAKERDYIFSALIAYLYIAQKSMANYVDNSEVLEFNKAFSFPETRDLCPKGYFDVVVALKEAMIAPTQNEAEAYIAVLDVVIPFMNEMLADFLSQKEHRSEITTLVVKHIDDLRQWVATNTDVVVSFYGVLFRKEKSNSRYYDKRYILLQSFVSIAQKYNIASFQDLKEKPLKTPDFIPSVYLDTPITAHYHDVEYIIKENNYLNALDEPWYLKEERLEDDRQRDFYNTINNFLWEDEVFCHNGKYGLMDCWGRVIVPAEYDNCIGGLSGAYRIIPNEMAVALNKDGKWGFVKRDHNLELLIPFKYDAIEMCLNGIFLTASNGCFGITSKLGRELLPPIMDDIYKPTLLDGDILFKHRDGYGLRLHNGYNSTEYFEDIDIHSGRLLSVRKSGVWGYIDDKAQFSTSRENAILNVGFNFESELEYLRKKLGLQELCKETKSDIEDLPIEDDFCEVEDLDDAIEEILMEEMFDAGVRMNFRDDSLSDIAIASISMERCVLNFVLNKEQKTFAIDMQHPYKLDLKANGPLELVPSWDGYAEAKKALQLWLNQTNIKSGVRNWAECIYAFNHNRDDKVTVVKYAENKAIDFTTISDRDFDTYDFPAIEFED